MSCCSCVIRTASQDIRTREQDTHLILVRGLVKCARVPFHLAKLLVSVVQHSRSRRTPPVGDYAEVLVIRRALCACALSAEAIAEAVHGRLNHAVRCE